MLTKLQLQTKECAIDNIFEENNKKMAIDIFNKLPSLFNITIHKKSRISVPSTVVLYQEMDRFNLLLKRISFTLETIIKAFSGKAEMDSELEEILQYISKGEIPSYWRKYCPQTQKALGSWIVHFLQRHNQYKQWVVIYQDYILRVLLGI